MISPNNLKMNYYKWFNKWYFKFKGIHFGQNMQAYNKVYLTGYYRSGGGQVMYW